MNWASKQAACLARHLHDLPAEFSAYRGNLTLYPDACPDAHRRVRKSFLRILNRWKTRHGYVAELRGVIHATDPLNAHYDYTAYSDAPAQPFREMVRAAWERSGGRRATCVPLHDDELDPVAKYQSKASSNKEDNVRAKREPHYLLNSRREIGLDLTWATAGFWGDTTADQIWATLVAEWFGDDEERQELAYFVAQRRAERGLPPAAKPEPETTPDPYIPGESVEQDIIHFVRRLPTTPETATGICEYAERWGVDAGYMRMVLSRSPRVKCLDGWTNPATGFQVWNRYYRDRQLSMETLTRDVKT